MKNTKQTLSNGTIEIYVGTYYKYNYGSLQGAWVDLTLFENYEEFMEFCKELHKDETDPEFMFQDYTCDFVFADMIGEHGIDLKVFEAIEMYAGLQDYQQEILAAYMDANGLEFFEAIENYEDNFVTDDIQQYAYDIVQEYNVPEFALNYFDYKSFERDLKMDFSLGSCNGKDFYFSA